MMRLFRRCGHAPGALAPGALAPEDQAVVDHSDPYRTDVTSLLAAAIAGVSE